MRQQYEDQIYVVKQYEGSVKADEAQIDTQKLNLLYCHIVSPVDGRVGLRLVDPGNFVLTTDTTGIVVVTQLEPMTIVFPVPEDDIPEITAQLRAGDHLQRNQPVPRLVSASVGQGLPRMTSPNALANRWLVSRSAKVAESVRSWTAGRNADVRYFKPSD